MVIELVSCPACGRKNASDRTTCLSCGADLPTDEESKPAKRLDLLGWLTKETFLPTRIQKVGDFLACMFYNVMWPIQVVVGLGLLIGGLWIGWPLLDDWYGLSVKSSTPFAQLTPNDLGDLLFGSVLLIGIFLGWGWVCLHIALYNLKNVPAGILLAVLIVIFVELILGAYNLWSMFTIILAIAVVYSVAMILG